MNKASCFLRRVSAQRRAQLVRRCTPRQAQLGAASQYVLQELGQPMAWRYEVARAHCVCASPFETLLLPVE